MTNKKLFVSASALGFYFECPRKFYLSRIWRPLDVKKPKYLIVGGQAHKILEGSLAADDESMFPESRRFAKKLKGIENDLGLDIHYREEWQKFNILPGIQFTRVLDGRGLDRRGQPVLLDYKTASMPWVTVLESGGLWVAPQAAGIQAVSYVIPKAGEETTWPKRIFFLVVASRPVTKQSFSYRYKQEDVDNLMRIILQVQDDWLAGEEAFLFHRGYNCGRCPWSAACYKAPGWEERYEKLDRH
jgi:hypothetical protein